MQTDLKEIYKKIKEAGSVLLLAHLNPDGDAIGSIMAMKTIIERLNISVDGVITDNYNFISKVPEANKLLTETNKKYDLTIIVDTNNKDRLGHLDYLYDQSKEIIILDHHLVERKINHLNYIDSDAPSATTVIYDFIKENNIELDYNLAFYLYLGLITDTGGFAFNNTCARAFNMASDLISYGVSHGQMYADFITPEYNLDYLYLKAKAISNLEIIDKKVAVTHLSFQDITNHPYDVPKNFVNLGRYIENIEVSLIFVEEKPNTYKVSLRSKKYLDVAKVADKFSGGGHKHASGIRFKDNYYEMKKAIIDEIIAKI